MKIGKPVSVHDHKAFAAKHMPYSGHNVEDTKVYTWRLNNWRNLEKRVTSPEFKCGGQRWRILLFPFGNSWTKPQTISLYLDYDAKSAPKGWHTHAQFALVVSNPHDPTIYTVKHAQHRFTWEECDFGFTRFYEWRKLFHVQEGHTRPMIEGGSVEVTVFVRVLGDPTGLRPPKRSFIRRIYERLTR
ncbi:hypothetical protein BD410DRAFT_791764 [Rickenella mellea]|uniref:MATH domain-containing protein n=1 Tax=Rickenella mellea TaxID=50990 RepID=A0A4Y7PZ24_9AGAM|nr:hypothetical protein BD410DRAFT_791764 [Rickenella mellea]